MSFFTASVTQCIPVKHTTYQLSVSTILIKKLGLPWSTYLNYRSKRNYERQIKQSLSCICSQGVELRATGAGLNCYFIPLKSSLWGVVLEKETRSIPWKCVTLVCVFFRESWQYQHAGSVLPPLPPVPSCPLGRKTTTNSKHSWAPAGNEAAARQPSLRWVEESGAGDGSSHTESSPACERWGDILLQPKGY